MIENGELNGWFVWIPRSIHSLQEAAGKVDLFQPTVKWCRLPGIWAFALEIDFAP